MLHSSPASKLNAILIYPAIQHASFWPLFTHITISVRHLWTLVLYGTGQLNVRHGSETAHYTELVMW